MKKIWFKFKFSISILIYLVIASAAVYFLIMPLVTDIKSLAYETQAKAIDREIEKKQIEKLPEIKKEWSDYESRQNLLNVILGQEDQVSFIESIEAIAQASGNKIDLRIEDGAKNTSFISKNKEMLKNLPYPDYFPVQISLEGDYAGLVKFVHMLENSQFYVNILSISAVRNASANSGRSNPFDAADSPSDNNENVENNDSIKTDIAAIVYIQKQ